MTTTDSNVWGGASGHTYTFTRRPDGTTDVDVVVVREGKNLKGRLLGVVLGSVGKRVLETAFENSVKAIEARNNGARSGGTTWSEVAAPREDMVRPHGRSGMSTSTTTGATTAPTEFLRAKDETYAYRRIGGGVRRPLLCLQHFTGTLDNWDLSRDLFRSAMGARSFCSIARGSDGQPASRVPTTVAGMAAHALQFLDGLCVTGCDVLGFSLGGMVAQQMAFDRPSSIHRMILARHRAARR